MKKVFSVLMTVCMAVGFFAFIAGAADLSELVLDEPMDLDWSGTAFSSDFCFVPKESGWYVFETTDGPTFMNGSITIKAEYILYVAQSPFAPSVDEWQRIVHRGSWLLYNMADELIGTGSAPGAVAAAYLESSKEYYVRIGAFFQRRAPAKQW